jgi:hypothetical protein
MLEVNYRRARLGDANVTTNDELARMLDVSASSLTLGDADEGIVVIPLKSGGLPTPSTPSVQDGGGWYGPASTGNGVAGTAAGLVELGAGSYTLGSNLKLYRTGWRGNQHVTTFSVGKVLKGFGLTSAVVGVGMDVVALSRGPDDPNGIGFGKFSANLIFTGVSFVGVPGFAIGTGYFALDALYPGGAERALDDQGRLLERNQAVLGSGFNLYRDPGGGR